MAVVDVNLENPNKPEMTQTGVTTRLSGIQPDRRAHSGRRSVQRTDCILGHSQELTAGRHDSSGT